MTKIKFKYKIPIKIDINSAVEYTAELISDTLKNTPKSVRYITEHLATAPGKGIRTKLLLISSMDKQGLIPKDAILAAASIEIFHLATLVHDDIIDNSSLRRGKESVQSKFSKKEAVICGDYLFCIAFACISDIYSPYTKFASKFAHSISKICLGELEQYTNNNNMDIGFYSYLKTINGKTAALFHIGAYAGALINNSSENEVRYISRFGTYYGIIFQIIDDCKDYKLNEYEALKPTKNDLASGVINLPLLMSFMKEPELRSKAKYILETNMDINSLLNDVYRLNGVECSYDIAYKYGTKAKNLLYNINNTKKVDELLKILNEQLLIIDNFK